MPVWFVEQIKRKQKHTVGAGDVGKEKSEITGQWQRKDKLQGQAKGGVEQVKGIGGQVDAQGKKRVG